VCALSRSAKEASSSTPAPLIPARLPLRLPSPLPGPLRISSERVDGVVGLVCGFVARSPSPARRCGWRTHIAVVAEFGTAERRRSSSQRYLSRSASPVAQSIMPTRAPGNAPDSRSISADLRLKCLPNRRVRLASRGVHSSCWEAWGGCDRRPGCSVAIGDRCSPSCGPDRSALCLVEGCGAALRSPSNTAAAPAPRSRRSLSRREYPAIVAEHPPRPAVPSGLVADITRRPSAPDSSRSSRRVTQVGLGFVALDVCEVVQASAGLLRVRAGLLCSRSPSPADG